MSFKNGSQSQTHSLQANDTFNKQQWLNCIRQAKETVLCAAGQAGVLDSEGPFLNPTTGSREPQGETKLEQMDQSDSESDCSMDTSEVSLDCERMEQTDSSCGSSRHIESNVWQKRVYFLEVALCLTCTVFAFHTWNGLEKHFLIFLWPCWPSFSYLYLCP